jgi:hypothetical protein
MEKPAPRRERAFFQKSLFDQYVSESVAKADRPGAMDAKWVV